MTILDMSAYFHNNTKIIEFYCHKLNNNIKKMKRKN